MIYNLGASQGFTGTELSHGEPGGPGGMPIPLRQLQEPVHFLDRHPLFNDPDANPYTDPYTGNPNAPQRPGYNYGDWY
jgi:hypothetical protein